VKETMIILGIDPGLAKTGCGVIHMEKGKPHILGYGVISTNLSQPLPRRLKIIYDEIQDLCREYHPDVAAIESIFFAANVKTAVAVAQARGVAILATEESGLIIAEYSPLQVKQAIVGYGRATKKQVQEMVRAIMCLQEIPKPDHAADALAIALTHAFRLNNRI
jgi:crossover junction endodeoxyribonuclease RuvC